MQTGEVGWNNDKGGDHVPYRCTRVTAYDCRHCGQREEEKGVVDLPGAYLSTSMEEKDKVMMTLQGTLSDHPPRYTRTTRPWRMASQDPKRQTQKGTI